MRTLEQRAASPAPVIQTEEPDWSLGWRYESVQSANGRATQVRVPLTADEARHPQEGYVMPERTEHDRISDDLCDMLRAYYASTPGMAVFRNLVFTWDHPDVGTFAPDVAVVANVRARDADRSQFVVADEGTRPLIVIEVVSHSSRKDDRVEKVRDYALVGVQEYVYIDHAVRRGQHFWELAGFRLQGSHYLPILPDEDGALYLETLHLRIGLDGDHVWLEATTTGKDLLTNLQARQALEAAEARITELEAQLQALHQQRGTANQS